MLKTFYMTLFCIFPDLNYFTFYNMFPDGLYLVYLHSVSLQHLRDQFNYVQFVGLEATTNHTSKFSLKFEYGGPTGWCIRDSLRGVEPEASPTVQTRRWSTTKDSIQNAQW